MKNLLVSALFVFTGIASAAQVECYGIRTAQNGGEILKSDIDLSFTIEKKENSTILHDFKGVVAVLAMYEDQDAAISEDNSYIGNFDLPRLVSNSKYRPIKYKGHTQFRDVDTNDTAGLESGMWGSLVLDLRNEDAKTFKAYYIFQAGDHMGGTSLLECVRL